MTFSKREPQPGDPGRGPWPVRFLAGVIRLFLWLIFGVTTLAAIVAGLLYFQLSQGPIHLPYVARIATQIFNRDSDRLKLELGDLVLTLGEAGAPAAIRFIDLRVMNADGDTVFAVPRLAAKFDTADLLRGALRPTQIVLIRPEARVLLTRDGKFRLGLGAQPAAGDVLAAETLQVEAIARILDGFVGDAEPIPALSRLSEIVISGADLTYVNEAAGRSWRTKRADLRIIRAETGLLARLSVGLADGAETGATVVITAERRRGAGGATRLDLRFDNLRPEHLAEQLDQMQWLRLFDAPLEGSLGATLHADGRIEGLTGRIYAGAGRILALQEQGQPFDSVELAFAYEAGLERMQVSELTLFSQALDIRLIGFVDLDRGADGAVTGLAAQFEVDGIRLSVPQTFAEQLQFEGGQIVARLTFEPITIEVAEAHLRTGDLVVDVSGQARAGPDGWHTDLRAAGRNLTIEQLVRHWPLVAAKNARNWVGQNIHTGAIDEFVAHMRFGAGEPLVDLDFVYSGLVSSYLKDMTPIREARGRGSLSLREFNLFMESGQVMPVEGSPVRLDGSTFRIPDLQAENTPAEVTIRATGATASLLALIDQQPLGLIAKLGLDPATIQGQGEVIANLDFPLITALKLDQIEVEANARLSALRMPFRLPGGQLLDISGPAVALHATTRELSVSGAVRIDGAPMVLDWDEYFGRGSNHRTIALKGPATPAMLERFGMGNAYFVGGQAAMKLRLTQTGSPSYAFDLDADLGPARLEAVEFGWQKAPGIAGHLEAVGHYGDGIRVSQFGLVAGDLKATGAIEFTRGGDVAAARIDRVQLGDLADVAIVAKRASSGAGAGELALKVSGNRLDLALFDNSPADGGGDGSAGAAALSADFDLSELALTPTMTALPATGAYRRDAAGDSVASLDGRLAGKVPFTAQYRKTKGEPGEIVVESDDAGALLKAADLFLGAEGGRLVMHARISPDGQGGIAGIARIKDVRISGAGTFKTILDESGVKKATRAAEGGGLAFDDVKVRFGYLDGLTKLGNTTAKGTLLAVKVEGTIDENNNTIDLVGAITPLYAITGQLDKIPVIGTIISGGKGEGIFAMVFKVRGSPENPEISVNPLSLFAPGFLRKIFTARRSKLDERFFEGLQREDN